MVNYLKIAVTTLLSIFSSILSVEIAFIGLSLYLENDNNLLKISKIIKMLLMLSTGCAVYSVTYYWLILIKSKDLFQEPYLWLYWIVIILYAVAMQFSFLECMKIHDRNAKQVQHSDVVGTMNQWRKGPLIKIKINQQKKKRKQRK